MKQIERIRISREEQEQEERAQEAAELIDEIVKLEYELNNKKAELAGLLAAE